MASSTQDLLQRLVDTALDLCGAHSAGICILEPGGEHGHLRWHAVAGEFAPDLEELVPAELRPSPAMLEQDTAVLFERSVGDAARVGSGEPAIFESLLVPFRCDGRPVGAVWAVAHTAEYRFDAEDARLLTNLSRFASTAYQMLRAVDHAEAARAPLERRVVERTRELAAANDALRESESRLAAELLDAGRLRELSSRLVREDDVQGLYREIVEAAAALLRADAASIEAIDLDGGDLRLLAWRGLDPTSFRRMSASLNGSRDAALLGGERVVIPDVERDATLASSSDAAGWRRLGLRAMQSTPLISRDGRVVGILSTHWREPHVMGDRELQRLDVLVRLAADLIESRHAQRELRDSRMRLAGALAAARMATWEWDQATDRTVTSASSSEVLGLARGQKIETSADWLRLVHPDDAAAHRAIVERARAAGDSWHHEFRIVRPRDGQIAWLEERATASQVPETGRLRLTGLIWDITERKLAEQRLQKSEERLRRALSIETVGVLFFDPAGRVLDANDTFLRMSGYSRQELEQGDLRWDLLTPEEWLPASRRAIDELRATGRITPYEKEYLRKDGSRWSGLVAATQLEPGEAVEFVVDLTDLHSAEAAAAVEHERREQHEREFVANAAHELRTPLTAIVAAVEALEAGAKDMPPQRDRFLRHLKREAARLTSLCDSLLVLAQIDSTPEVPRHAVPLRPLLEDVARRLQALPGVSVGVDAPAALAVVTNRGLAERVIANLAENAAKHTRDGTIELRAHAIDGSVVVEVRDSGPGMPATTASRAFDRFYRGGARQGDGFGLGLSIAHQAAVAVGGELTLESPADGGVLGRLVLPNATP